MIYYVAFYNPIEELGNRVANYAGEDKIDYICKAINEIGEQVTILSNTKSIKNKYLKKVVYNKTDQKRVIMFASFPKKGKLLHSIDVVFGYFQLSKFLIKNVREKDVVIVYHSLGYRNLIGQIRKIKKFRYILEVEELFQYIEEAKSSFKSKENVVFKRPDGFIFSNSYLDKIINVNKKPSVIVNGIYKIEPKIVDKGGSNKVNVVYAGSLELQKGVDYVIRAAEFLDQNFEIRIIGFGSEVNKKRILNLIEKTNEKSRCIVYFDGTYKGKEYFEYLQNCDIGVCIQSPDDSFNMYEFPSKIFSYMSNGLKVVTNRLKQIEQSKVYSYITVANSVDPKEVARAIHNAQVADENPESILKALDYEFKLELKKLLEGE